MIMHEPSRERGFTFYRNAAVAVLNSFRLFALLSMVILVKTKSKAFVTMTLTIRLMIKVFKLS